MPSTINKAAILEKAHSTSILLILLAEGPMKKTVLYQKITKNTKAVSERLTKLESEGLITISVSEEHPFPHIIRLTPKGREVAKKVREIENILGGENNLL